MTTKKNSFINAISSNKQIDLNDKEINSTDEIKEENINENGVVEPNIINIRKGFEFIDSIVDENKDYKERAVIYSSSVVGDKLRMLSLLSGHSIIQIVDSVLSDYFEQNKNQIKTLYKKKYM